MVVEMIFPIKNNDPDYTNSYRSSRDKVGGDDAQGSKFLLPRGQPVAKKLGTV
jgi:hypothetical protein